MAYRPSAVVTPEAVPLDLETAGIGSRFLALVVDLVIEGAVLLAVIFAFSRFVHGGGWPFAAAFFFLLFGLLWGYPIAFETLWRGRTIGKAAMGLRVVTKEGGQVGFRHAAIRAALGLVDFGIASGAVAVICVLVTADNQRLGDLVAGTLVLRERTGARRPAPAGFAPPPGLEGYAAGLDVAGLGEADYGVVRAFLLRAPSLPPAVRGTLAAQVSDAVIGRVQPPPPPEVPAEAFLACVAAAYRRRSAAPPLG